ncbi:MAG TPA: methionyl-tRNA formyltransferase [Chthoniobacterales bacterium]|jgi:methionyl-tRNA formyltransferase|nr:methionyl-tRNA formyltransferase [Chthoniobacterales bacterium]
MRIVFIGTGEIGVPVLRALLHSRIHELVGVVTQPDRPVGRDQRIQSPPIKQALTKSSVPVFQPERIRHAEAVAQIHGLAPEVIIVMAYGQILPTSVLEIPTIACLNLHASLLPRHRGAAPIQAAIVAGETETGITVIYMDAGLDTGDILLQRKLEILPNDTGGSLHDRLAQVAPDALRDALGQLAEQTAPRHRQDATEATYAPRLTREAGQIDWSETAEMIERKIRAFDPWPGAFTRLIETAGKTRHLKIFRAALAAALSGAPGTVATPNDSELLVAAGQGALRLEEVQLEGKRRMAAAEFLRGFSSPSAFF